MTLTQITDGQISAFAQALVKNGIIDKSQIAENKDLINEALRISQTKEGLAQVVYNHTQPTGSELISGTSAKYLSYTDTRQNTFIQ